MINASRKDGLVFHIIFEREFSTNLVKALNGKSFVFHAVKEKDLSNSLHYLSLVEYAVITNANHLRHQIGVTVLHMIYHFFVPPLQILN